MSGLQKLKTWMDSEVYAPTYADIVNKIKELITEEEQTNTKPRASN